MKRVIVESPYAGDIEANVTYARHCVRDAVLRGEAPIASHLLFTQPGILRDDVPEERALGIAAGLAWQHVADYSAFYVNHGWSPGMLAALESAYMESRAFRIRTLYRGDAPPTFKRTRVAISGIVPLDVLVEMEVATIGSPSHTNKHTLELVYCGSDSRNTLRADR